MANESSPSNDQENPNITKKKPPLVDQNSPNMEKKKKPTDQRIEEKSIKKKGITIPKNWDKFAVGISLVSLVLSFVLGFVAFQSLDLAEKANNLTEKSLELQIMQQNYPIFMSANIEPIILDSGGHYTIWDDLYNFSTTNSGWLNGSITIITPHKGTVSINKEKFYPDDVYSNLIFNKANQTTVDFMYPDEERDPMIVPDETNILNFSYRLRAEYYPDPNKIFTIPEDNRIIPIGYLHLEVKFETPAGLTSFEYLDSTVLVVLRNY